MNKILAAMLFLIALPGSMRGAIVAADFVSENTVPIISPGYAAAGNEVAISLGHAPRIGASLTIVDNTSSDFITGSFSNLAQGQRVLLHFGGAAFRFIANYYGGNGNDLVLQWADTAVYGWGANRSGELGDYRLSFETTPVPVSLTGALQGKTIMSVTSGSIHTVALCTDGTLASWGKNDFSSGLLGNNSSLDSRVPVLVDRTGVLAGKTVVQIAAGSIHTLALCTDGTIAAWGYNSGTLGNNTATNSPVPVAVVTTGALAGKRVTAIAAGMVHSLALCSDGTVASWGNNSDGRLGVGSASYSTVPLEVDRTGVLAGKTVVAIAGGGRHSLMLCSDGTMAACGANTYGELGNGTTTGSNVPVAVNMAGALAGKTVVAIAAGGYYYLSHNLALCSDGTLASWGSNENGQLGDGGTTNRSLPVDITQAGALAGKTVVSISASMDQSYAQCSDGSVVAWGGATVGLSGNPSRSNSNTPVTIVSPLAGSGAAFLKLGSMPIAQRGFGLISVPLDNTRFANLEVDCGTRVAASPTGAASYSVAVPHGTQSITVIPTLQDVDAAVTVNGSPVPSGSGSLAIPLGQILNTIQVAVTAPDGTTTTSYELTVVRPDGVTAVFSTPAHVPISYSSFDATGITLDLSLACPLPVGTELKVIDNTGIDFIRGRFTNLAQGQIVSLTYGTATCRLVADYYGGDGNDLVLRWASNQAYMWGSGVPLQPGSSESYGKNPVTFTNSGALKGRIIEKMGGGYRHSIAICTDGTLVGWGYYSAGALGNTGSSSSSGRIDVPLELNLGGALAGRRAVAITVGDAHSLALCSDGTLASWGSNYSGELGNNTSVATTTPVAVNDYGSLVGRRVVSISAFDGTNLALCSDGTLSVWGKGYGKVPALAGTGGALKGRVLRSISQGSYHSLGICTDGEVVAWGYNTGGAESLLNDPTEIYGQLGHGDSYSSSIPVLVKRDGVLAGKSVTSVIAGSWHSVALCSDGTVATWGRNNYSQLGNNDRPTERLAPVMVSTGALAGKSVNSIAVGWHHGVAICSDGSLASWGSNSSGQLGDGTTEDGSSPVAVVNPPLRPGERISGLVSEPEGNHTLALVTSPFNNSALAGLGMSPGTMSSNFLPGKTSYFASVSHDKSSFQVTPVTSDPDARVTVNGVASPSGSPVPVSVAADITPVTLVVTAPDGVATTTYQISVVRPPLVSAVYSSPSDVPVAYPAFDATGMTMDVSLACPVPNGTTLMLVKNTGPGPIIGRFSNLQQGQLITLAFNNITYRFLVDYYGGTGNDLVLRWPGGKAWSWGPSSSGVLGNNSISTSKYPQPVTSTGALANKTIISLTMGDSHSLALCSDGSVVTWGSHSGISTPLATPIPMPATGALAGKKVIQIASGSSQRLALCSDGSVAMWGQDLGSPSTSLNMTGVLAGKTVISVAAGASHNLALCSDGTIGAWGTNTNGQLGNNLGSSTAGVPVLVTDTGALAGKTVVAISAGSSHSLALCSDGTVAAWGSNTNGQLGDGTTTRRNAPVSVVSTGVLAGKTVVAISAGGIHNLALCSDGTLVAWGKGGNGCLGNGSTADSSVPIKVTNTGVLAGKTVTAVSAGLISSMVLCSDGTLFSWGSNSSGQLGNDTLGSISLPAAVSTAGQAAGTVYTVIGYGSQAVHSLSAALFSNNAKLAALSLGAGTLTPSFSPATTSYTVNFPTTIPSLTITPTLASPFAIARIKGTQVNSGTASPAIPLAQGSNTITVDVTAEDGSAGQYVLVINNAPFEAWKNRVFPNSADRNNPLVSGELAAPAGDGISNLMKYALGLDPFVPSADFLPQVSVVDGRLALAYRKSKSAPDVSYTVQAQDSVGENLWNSVNTVASSIDQGDYWLVTVRDIFLVTERPVRFMRLKVVK